ncbi:MAG: hypothetical protein JW715_00575 [Sedimentisphaerales bacterium]|nr:hypothetical protein [Sedimentisphaerales bacterium]
MTDDIRKERPGPLTYTKSVVTVSGLSKPAEVTHYERMRDLKSRPNRHLLRSIFEDLKNWTGGKHYGQRGYLITTDCKPASYMYLAAQLTVDLNELKEAMTELEQIGLLEIVVIDGHFDNSGSSRTQPDVSGQKRTPLKKRKNKRIGNGKVKEKNKSATAKVKSKTKEIYNNKHKEQTDNKQKESSQGQDEKSSTQSPPTTQPIEPTESDTGGLVIQFTNPLHSVNHTRSRRSEPQHIGDIAAGMMHKYSPDAKSFAGDVFQALQLACKPDSVQGRQELASFASIFMDASYSGLSPPALDALRERAIAEAKRIKKNWKSRQGKPAAVFVDVFKKMVNKAKTKPAM